VTPREKQLLDARTVAKAEMLGLATRSVVEGFVVGEHRSPFHGFAIEFTQHREYTPGDDLRHLDWKVLGRLDRYYIKQYEQDTNVAVQILVDGSASMRYGSGESTKYDHAAKLAACLAYVITHQRDAAGLMIFDDAVREQVPRTDNPAKLPQFLHTLAGWEPSRPTGLPAVLDQLARQLKRRGIVVVISDLLDDEEGVLHALKHIRFAGSEAVVFHILDREELEFSFEGPVLFEGLEAPESLLTRPSDIRRSYLEQVEAWRKTIRRGCEKNNFHYIPVDTGAPLADVLSGYLAFRKRLTRR
jgi:uncharacterized protein (DUF58 family)